MGLLYDTTELRQVPPPEPWQPTRYRLTFLMLVTSVGNLFALPARNPWTGQNDDTFGSRCDLYEPGAPCCAADTAHFRHRRHRLMMSSRRSARLAFSAGISLDRVRRLKESASVTVNVVLAICCRGTACVFAEKDALPDKPLLVVAAPVSLRTEDGSSQREIRYRHFVRCRWGRFGPKWYLSDNNTRKKKKHIWPPLAPTGCSIFRTLPFALANGNATLHALPDGTASRAVC